MNCACCPCKTAQEKGCAHPAKCWQATQKLLDTLHPKWRPIDPNLGDTLWFSEDQLHLNEHTREQNKPQIFNPDLTSISDFVGEFWVFVDDSKVSNSPAVWPPREQEIDAEEETTVFLCGTHENQGYESAKSAFTIWYGDNDPRNTTQRTRGCSQTKEMDECQALLEALMQTPRDTKLNIQLRSPYIQNILMNHLPRIENKGWINTPNREILQTIVAILQACNNLTTFGKLKDEATIARMTESARAGLALNDENEEPNLAAPENFQMTGLHLSDASQSALYQGILEKKKPPTRATSSYNIGRMKA